MIVISHRMVLFVMSNFSFDRLDDSPLVHSLFNETPADIALYCLPMFDLSSSKPGCEALLVVSASFRGGPGEWHIRGIWGLLSPVWKS
jgi:hypothetical protein